MKLLILSIYIFCFLLPALLLLTFTSALPAHAQVSMDASGMGLVIVGYDSRICDSSIEGAIRYDSSANSIQVCLPPAGPSGCPTIGDVCADGSVYAGLSPDGSLPMYTTPADAGQFSWNDGSLNRPDIPTLENCTAFNELSCDTGEANTTLLAAFGTGPSPAPYVAARHCDGLTAHGFDDWYLPAKYELTVLQNNRLVIGGFDLSGTNPTGYYWSSSEGSFATIALGLVFSNAATLSGPKQISISIRCVRKDSTSWNWTNWGD